MTTDDAPQAQPSSPKPSMMEIILHHRDQEKAFAEIVRLYPEATIDQMNAALMEAIYVSQMAGAANESG
jgi:phage gp29-like protein